MQLHFDDRLEVMFVKAIEIAAEFTRPLCTISRNFGSTTPIPGAATLFLINSDGWAITCRHVAEVIVTAGPLNERFEAYKAEKKIISTGKKYRSQLEALDRKYGFARDRTVEIYTNFVDCVDKMTDFDVHLHPTYDLALIKFNGFSQLFCKQFPIFASDGSALKQGKSICRLGFPFPEFRNYRYDAATDNIRWIMDLGSVTPRFPLEGMVTRHLGDGQGNIYGFELSTPGLRGQSGAPAFDSDGRIWGMQSATNHLDLDFDVDTEVLRAGQKKRVTNSPFLHVGICIHIDVIKAFMRSMGARFSEG
jgi:hypothetical protein